MDFAFSEEQRMLRDQARQFLADKLPPERVAEVAESSEGWDEKSWREMAELGWTSLSVPEDSGGAGMGFIDEAVLFEELGFALYPGPYFSSIALALPALIASPDLLEPVVAGEAAVTVAWAEEGVARLADVSDTKTEATGDGDDYNLTGEKVLVPDAGIAAVALVVARASDGLGVFAVSLDETGSEVLDTMDSTRRLGRLQLAGTAATLVVEPGTAEALLEKIRLRALAALALEAVGVAQQALDLATTHAKEREQFNKPIGTYQAVAHQVADTYADVELARSLAYWAAWCVDEDEGAALAAPAAKAFAAEAAVRACERSIQVHGGIGFTWEHVLHRYYKRAQWIESFDGYGTMQRRDLAAQLLG